MRRFTTSEREYWVERSSIIEKLASNNYKEYEYKNYKWKSVH